MADFQEYRLISAADDVAYVPGASSRYKFQIQGEIVTGTD